MSLDRAIKPSKAQAVELFASKLQQDISVGWLYHVVSATLTLHTCCAGADLGSGRIPS